MSRAQEATFEQVLNAVKVNNQTVNDDHNSGKPRSIAGLAELVNKNGYRHIVGLYANTYFCLNTIYLDAETGLPHISTSSVGGNVVTADTTVEAGVDKYNEQQKDMSYSCGNLENVVVF